MIDLKQIPNSPGCYLYKDKDGSTIYVGKAKDLKKRISSYFQKKILDAKTQNLVQNIAGIDFIITDSEKEALILESNLVKKFQPKYNIDLKDSKRYAYIEITGDEFPRVVLARKRESKGEYYGPFTSGLDRDLVIETINKHFQLRTCRKLPKKECIRFHMGLCPAPCIGKVSRNEYASNVGKARLILNGQTKQLGNALKENMLSASKKEDFERALTLRDQLFALEVLEEKQNMERARKVDEDVFAAMTKDNQSYILVFNIYKGTLHNKKEFVIDFKEGYFEEFLSRFYESHPIPREIITKEEISEGMLQLLEDRSQRKLSVVNPEKGEKKHLLDLAFKNLEISFFGKLAKLEALRDRLKLESTPITIECFDISHLGGTSTVGSMVQFKNGIANKQGYRRFKITTVEGIDDFRSIAEIVRRRYARLVFEKAEVPDLIIIDGGKGQLGMAVEELKKFNLRIPVISLAKRDEEVFLPGRPHPIKLEKKDHALHLLQEIRDEAHRFAITYNRLLRSKKIKEELDW